MDHQRRPLLALAACLVLAACDDSSAARGQADAGRLDLSQYQQTFAETFDRFDVSAWGPGTRWIAHTPWHGDFGDAVFTDPEPGFPFQTASGILRIEARRGADGKWRSGLISSRDRQGAGGIGGFAQRFGYFEIETKLPPGPGTWPAFWLSGIETKPGAEIDVFEYYGHAPDSFHANIHTWYDGQQTFGDGKIVAIPSGSATADFNRYGVAIDHDWVTFYFNRQQVWRTPTRPEDRQPMYMLVDLGLARAGRSTGLPILRSCTSNPSPPTLVFPDAVSTRFSIEQVNPMKILHIAKHCRDANGNVNVAVDLSCAQVVAGHEVVFASEGGTLQALLERSGVRILPVRQPWR